MSNVVQAVLNNPIGAAFAIILVGELLGRLSVRGVSLGTSGVLFAGLAFAHFGWVEPQATKVLADFGVVLFVYAVGLQAGPRFVRTVRSKGVIPLVVGLATVVGGAAVAGFLARLLHLDAALAVGLFAGALTSTPALAAATEVAGQSAPAVSVAYGVAYPFGVVGVVLFGQLMPRWLSRWPAASNRQPDLPSGEPVQQRCYLVQNPACIGKRISALRLHELASVNISRVMRGAQVLASAPDVELAAGDVIMAVGTGRELDRLALIIGPPVPVEVEMKQVPNVVARDVYISESAFAGRSLRQLHVRSKYNVVITRVRREGMEFVPRGDFVLEIGDQVRAVGYEPDVVNFERAAGIHERRLHETGILEFAFGLVVGIVLGLLPIPVPMAGTVKLGLAGGPLFVGLLLGHYGRIGRLRLHVPVAARYLMRELGLMLFLVGAGTAAGADLLPVLRQQGLTLAALAITTVVAATAVAFVLSYVVFRQSPASSMGLTCGAMTSTPGLGAASSQFDSDVPALAYAAVYPLALVAMTVVAQLMLAILR